MKKRVFSSLTWEGNVVVSDGKRLFLGLEFDWPVASKEPNRLKGIAGINLDRGFSARKLAGGMILKGMVKPLETFNFPTLSQLRFLGEI